MALVCMLSRAMILMCMLSAIHGTCLDAGCHAWYWCANMVLCAIAIVQVHMQMDVVPSHGCACAMSSGTIIVHVECHGTVCMLGAMISASMLSAMVLVY